MKKKRKQSESVALLVLRAYWDGTVEEKQQLGKTTAWESLGTPTFLKIVTVLSFFFSTLQLEHITYDASPWPLSFLPCSSSYVLSLRMSNICVMEWFLIKGKKSLLFPIFLGDFHFSLLSFIFTAFNPYIFKRFSFQSLSFIFTAFSPYSGKRLHFSICRYIRNGEN